MSFSFHRFRVIFIHIIPCSAIIILNSLLCRALKQHDLTRMTLLAKPAATNQDLESKLSATNRKINRSHTGKQALLVTWRPIERCEDLKIKLVALA